MSERNWCAAGLLAGWIASLGCSGSDADPAPTAEASGVSTLLPFAGTAGDSATPAVIDPAFATFVDPDTGILLQDVRDADRDVVHFHIEQHAMVSAASGDAVSGWVTDGNDLRWNRGGSFRVRFGSEAGEARAYFTEAGPGTICNLSIKGPEQLSISATSETPPHD